MLRIVFLGVIGMMLSACANPLNDITRGRYAGTCSELQASGQLAAAEEACRRALINVRIGNLGPEMESQELYNLARVKYQIGKVAEAENLFIESLKIQDSLPKQDAVKVGRRLTQIAMAMGDQEKLHEALPYLDRLAPIAGQFAGQERVLIKQVLSEYAKQCSKVGLEAEASKLRSRADSL